MDSFCVVSLDNSSSHQISHAVQKHLHYTVAVYFCLLFYFTHTWHWLSAFIACLVTLVKFNSTYCLMTLQKVRFTGGLSR